jgi:hypothetical protein
MLSFDPATPSPGFFSNPYPIYQMLREQDPLHRCPDGTWFLTRHADLERIYRDRSSFSSDKKTVFAPKFGDRSPLYEHHTTSLVFNDAPYHTRVRRAVVGALTPHVLKDMRPGIIDLVDRLLARIEIKGEFDAIQDFAAVSLCVASTSLLTVNPAVPAKTVRELVDLIKANPGKYSFSSAGAGTQAHLAGEQFRIYLGLDLVHVPYTGGGPAAAAVVAGHTPIGFSSPQAAGQFVKEGTLRGLAVTSKTRSQLVPGVPTMIEAGYPEIEGDSWVGILAPAGTPKDIVALLHRESA